MSPDTMQVCSSPTLKLYTGAITAAWLSILVISQVTHVAHALQFAHLQGHINLRQRHENVSHILPESTSEIPAGPMEIRFM